MTEQGSELDDVVARLEALEADVEDVATDAGRARDRANWIHDEVVEPLQEENEALRRRVDDLEEMVIQHEKRFDGLVGLDSETSTAGPEKRANDLREAMIRRAKTRNTDKGKLGLWKDEVKALFVDLGYVEEGDRGTRCTVSKPDLYKAMEDVAEMPGFAETSKTNEQGTEVKAVKVDVPAVPGESVGRNPTTGGTPRAATDGGESTSDTT